MDLSVYDRTIKSKKYTKPQNLYELIRIKDLAGIRQWFRKYLVGKEYDMQYHILMRDQAVKKYNEVIKEKGDLMKAEFTKQLNKDYLSVGKEIPTMVKGNFSKAVNKRLDTLHELSNKYYAIACAHHTMIVLK